MPCLSATFDPGIGPLVMLGVAAPAAVRASVMKATPAKADVTVFPALIDTGASITCIASNIAQAARLPLIGKQQMASASHVVSANVYLADLVLPFGEPEAGGMSFVVEAVLVMEFQPHNTNYLALLGRDVLCQGLLTMTGFDRRVVICI